MCFQVINNACATQAIVSVLLNCSHSDMLLGDTLTEFREFSQSFDAAVRSWYFSPEYKQRGFFVCFALCALVQEFTYLPIFIIQFLLVYLFVVYNNYELLFCDLSDISICLVT